MMSGCGRGSKRKRNDDNDTGVAERRVSLPRNAKRKSTDRANFPLLIQRTDADLMRLGDLPDELLRSVLLYLGYMHQQRIIRVCKRWRAIVVDQIDHIYVEITTQYTTQLQYCQYERWGTQPDRSLFHALRSGKTSSTPAWKYANTAVRHLTCSGVLRGRFKPVADSMAILALRFPRLIALNLTNVVIHGGRDYRYLWHELKLFQQARPTVHVRLCASTVMIMNDQYDAKVLFGKRRTHHFRIPDFVLTTVKEFEAVVERAIWPFTTQQTTWLAQYASPQLTEDRVKVFKAAVLQTARISICEEHHRFCKHLDVAFYQDKLDGRSELLVTWYILKQNIPGIVPPPFEFTYQEFGLIGERRVLL